ncbi:MAG: 2Fe-2S iron-sulfur cluster binding domain-containing protein [Candidatus Eremiobacteraeota bacterium]|nr:2Fe-2S iron-sulfur cluster binding domain-containing protein [Candidatus Eremiobacteraeota bacterium]
MSIKVKFVASGVEAEWTEGNILAFAESVDVMPDYGCRGGACGCCETKLLGGDVTYLEENSFEPDAGHVLLCCTRPKEGIEVLELDL